MKLTGKAQPLLTVLEAAGTHPASLAHLAAPAMQLLSGRRVGSPSRRLGLLGLS